MARGTNITLRQVRAFIELARYRSFTKAADAAHVTQSALSALIRDLEANLGVRLVDRTTRTVHLTDAGIDFLAAAERIDREIDVAVENSHQRQSLRRGRLSIAVPPLLGATVFPRALSRFVNAHPEIEVIIRDCVTTQMIEHIVNGTVEFGIGTFQADNPLLTVRAIFRDRLILVTPREHPLAERNPANWSDLKEAPLISVARGSGLRTLLERTLESTGNYRPLAYEVNLISTALALVTAKVGISVLPSCITADATASGLACIDLEEPVVSREVQVAVREGSSLSAAAEAFIALFRQQLKHDAPTLELL